MEVITAIAVIGLGLKIGLAIGSVVGVTSGIEWFNKKTFSGKKKKGGDMNASELDTEKFHRSNL